MTGRRKSIKRMMAFLFCLGGLLLGTALYMAAQGGGWGGWADTDSIGLAAMGAVYWSAPWGCGLC